MVTHMRNWLLVGLMGLLVACGGGGGGNSASGVEPGPAPPGGSVPPVQPIPPAPFSPYADAEVLLATITNVTLDDDERAIVDFQLTDGNGTAIVDLEVDNVRFTIAKLQGSLLGNLTGTWQSYKNAIEQPEVGTGTEQRLQGTYEREEEGFTNNGDGTYRYHFALSLTNQDQDILDQAASEGLDLSYEPDRTNRVSMQFDGSKGWGNPYYDWVPATGATDGLFTMDIAATDNCNLCHDPLAVHGSGRREIQYCVTCHNAGTTDADSTNTVDMKVMIHKIHAGANLPSVQDGGEYAIYGFRNSKHDYSNLHYPQDIRNCVNCHVGTGTIGDRTDLTVTSQGDNWAEVVTAAACGSCHEDVDFSTHKGGQPDDSSCAQCHAPDKKYGVENSHRMLVQEASQQFNAKILEVKNSMPGQNPVVTFEITDPEGNRYDLMSDPVFTGARLSMQTAWSSSDYENTGNEEDMASSVSADIMSGAVANGDGSYDITMPVAIPNGSKPPGIAATGSGAAVIEGRLSIALEEGQDPETVPLINAHEFFSINETDGSPNERRTSVDLQNCLSCHGTLSLHGSNRTDDIDSCVTCHNPRNTDREVREIASNPPTDGKDEESLDFKTMIHGIHAAAIRENPLQIVGYRGFSTHVYDEEAVHYPGNLANCTACHTEEGFLLPLAPGVLATTVDTGANHQSPTDDTVVTPITSVCSSCHDKDEDKSHMTFYGGSFSTSQSAIDSGAVHEDCSSCHREGSGVADAWEIHQKFLE